MSDVLHNKDKVKWYKCIKTKIKVTTKQYWKSKAIDFVTIFEMCQLQSVFFCSTFEERGTLW